MRPFVALKDWRGAVTRLGHGDLIGRLDSAALWLDDPRISEAHAMVSLRGAELRLIGLRGPLLVGGERRPEVELREQLRVGLAAGLELLVDELFVPTSWLAIEAPDGLRVPLRSVLSLYPGPPARAVPGFRAEAAAFVWGEGRRWRWRGLQGETTPIEAGAQIAVDGAVFHVVEVDADAYAGPPTVERDAPLCITAHYDSVEIQFAGEVSLVVGLQARLISELVEIGGPVPWEVLARELWGAEAERNELRARLDMAVFRLRRRLRDLTGREDLVLATGRGHVQLVTRPGDVVRASV